MRKKSVVFDIDGTVADHKHRLHFIQGKEKDYDMFYEQAINDTPIIGVIATLIGLKNSGYQMIGATGRPEKYRQLTETWLMHHAFLFDKIVMRPDGDYTPGDQLKSSWLREGKLGDPLIIFEDDPKIVSMFRRKDRLCVQVQDYSDA